MFLLILDSDYFCAKMIFSGILQIYTIESKFNYILSLFKSLYFRRVEKNSFIISNDSVSGIKPAEDVVDKQKQYKIEIVWRNVFAMVVLHVLAFYSIYLSATGRGTWQSLVWMWFVGILSSMGVQAGTHRLWCHKSYKAKLPLRILLAILQTVALQNDIYEWSRDHRVHHKFAETDADPHNSNRGFFFCHMGWLLCKKHNDVKEKGKSIDMSDLWSDPVVRFQRRFYVPLVLLLWGIIPTAVPTYFFGEPLFASICANSLRYIFTLHLTWTVNSVAHLYGMQPYDKNVKAKDSIPVIYWGLGEGYHNYHHVFPYDYSASEFGWQNNWNPCTAFIDFFAWIGWAYDRRVVQTDIVKQRSKRCGDNSISNEKLNYWIDMFIGAFVTSFFIILLIPLRAIFV